MLAGCGKPFNVKSRPDAPPSALGASGASSGIVIQAETVTDEDYLYDTFQANLIMAGVLPVRIRATNNASEAVDFKKARFELRTAGRRRYKAISAREAFNHVFNYYGISVYTKRGYDESKDDFASHGIDLSEPLAPGDSREGLLFFRVPDEEARAGALVLAVRDIDLDRKKSDAEIELSLDR
jgi:hypothetical protein